MTEMQNRIIKNLQESSRTLEEFSFQAPLIEKAGRIMIHALRKGKKVISFGNGGSAADAQHLAAELSGRFERDRRGLPAVALTTNSSTLTAIANDYDYKQIFSRQLEGFVKRGDVVVAISTSGNSLNVIEGVKKAKKEGAVIIGWTGRSGGKLKKLCNVCLSVPSDRTSRIQEGHLAVLHSLCALIEEELFGNDR